MGIFNKKLSLAVDSYKLSEKALNTWHYSAPKYAFKYRFETGLSTMFLPINPENLKISTSFATNYYPTLYGTVEEHSETRYFNITISGNTGIAPIGPKLPDPNRANNNVKTDIYQGRATNDNEYDIGIYPHQSGYVAFHALYRFLLRYKRDATKNNRNEPLYFCNYKDNNFYKVSLTNFTLTRSSSDPFLYNYSITMVGYYIATIDKMEQITDTVTSVLTNVEDLNQYAEAIKGGTKMFKDVYKLGRIKF
jgi:hypothetical protein